MLTRQPTPKLRKSVAPMAKLVDASVLDTGTMVGYLDKSSDQVCGFKSRQGH